MADKVAPPDPVGTCKECGRVAELVEAVRGCGNIEYLCRECAGDDVFEW